jgi:hypothetical protein
MAFEELRSNRGAPMVRCICDDCAREEVVGAVHGKDGKEGHGKAIAKVQRLGWTYVGKRLRCCACENKRKVAKMSNTKMDAPKASAPVRTPTREQKRAIIDLLDDVYDKEQDRKSLRACGSSPYG